MSMELQPDPAQTEQVINILKQTQSPDNRVQKQIRENLANLQPNPEFNGYLAHVFSLSNDTIDCSIRSCSGILLKNNCIRHFNTFPDSIKSIIVQSIFKSMGDPFTMIRSTAGTLLSSVVRADHFNCWLNVIFPNIQSNLCSPVANEVKAEGCLLAVQRLLEDYDGNLNENFGMDCAMDIVHKCGQLFHHPDVNLRFAASECFSSLLYNSVQLDETSLRDLFVIADDSDHRIRKNVCRCLVIIVHREIEALFPCFPDFLQYILKEVNDESEEVAIEACEVWSALSEQHHGHDLMAPCIAKLAPLLFNKMKYSEGDPAMTTVNQEISCEDVCLENTRHRGMMVASESDKDESDDEHGNVMTAGGWDGGHLQWNLRKGAAYTLDQLSHVFPAELLPALLPSLQNAMMSEDWLLKESAILALGAISEGCYDSMLSYMHQLMPFIFACLEDSRPLVRSISCWTAGRYCSWIVNNHGDLSFFDRLVELFIARLRDTNTRVQEAACSAMSILEEESRSRLAAFVPRIVAAFKDALNMYKTRNRVILFDTIGILVDCTKGSLDPKIFIDELSEILLTMLDELKDDDPTLFSLLECITSLVGASASDPSIMPVAEHVFYRCFHLLEKYLKEQIECELNQCRFTDSDFVVVPLDSVASITSTLGSTAAPLCSKYQMTPLLMQYLCENKVAEVRQSALALIGDIAKANISIIKAELPKIMELFLKSISAQNYVAIKNNAIWAFGEIVSHLPANEAAIYIDVLIEPIVEVMSTRVSQKPLADNTAITIGKICSKCPEKIVNHLDKFIAIWLRVLCGIYEKETKEQTLLGMCGALKLNPNSLLPNFVVFCEAVVSFDVKTIDGTLKQLLQEILNGYKAHVGMAEWDRFKNSIDPGLLQQLSNSYSI